MGTTSPSARPLSGRLFGGLLALVFAVAVGGWLSADLAAQNSKEEKEDTVKPKKKAPEVDDEGPAKPRKVIDVDDEGPTPAKPAKPRPKLQPPPEPQSLTSIDEALRETKNSALRDFYRDLKMPHDVITVRGLGDGGVRHAIEPTAQYYSGEQPSFKNGYLDAWTYDAEWQRSKSTTRYTSALRIQPYEELVIDAVDDLLKQDPARLRLTRDEMLKAAETVLAGADRFHTSAVASNKRRGDEWQPLGKRLHERLFEVQRQRLESFITADDWGGALGYARTLAEAYRDPEERGLLAAPLVRMIQAGLPARPTEEQLLVARDRFRQLDELFPGNQAGQAIARSLRGQAESLLGQARELERAGKHQEARLRLQLAEDIYPQLPELTDALLRMDRDHPVLRVGVRDLPAQANMIPGQTITDMELRASELIYEGLVKLRVDPGVGQRYVPGLAGAAPRLVPLGREFRIARAAAWSDGTPVTVGDVKETLSAMKQERWVGYSPMWGQMIDAEGGGDSFRLSLHLSQGYLDPLSLMNFKILPQSVLRKAQQADAAPVGSGPFRYVKTGSILNRKTALFVANPAYSSREGKLGLPRIREIQFVLFADPADDPAEALQKGQIDLLVDLTAAKANELRHKVEVRGPMTNRRVYFLAVNHRASPLRGNLFLRRALALAINRQAILERFFGGAREPKVHHALNGPFPAGSWPCDPKNVPAELYNPDEAKAQAREAVKAAGGPIRLTLKYPDGDKPTADALAYLCESVNNELRIDDKTFIELKTERVDPHKLREDVEQSHQYELAYYHHDHPSEAYWIAPLFDIDPRATGINGSNYLGYIDGELQAEFARAKDRRDFAEVQQAMRLIHRMLDQKMPLIPLWQLDTFFAYRRGLSLDRASVDPLLIFNDVEQWELGQRQ
jgi:ABC-type transport system substrate-binding protein